MADNDDLLEMVVSFDNSDMLGAFTELEIAAGVPDLAFGTNRTIKGGGFGYDIDEEVSECDGGALTEYQSAREISATRMSEKCDSLEKFKVMLVNKVINEEMDYIIARYSKKEALPDIYHGLVRQDQCLEVLIKGMLGKVAKINITSSLESEVKEVVCSILLNEEMQTPYTRVGKLQRFIHGKVDEEYGESSCAKLPRVHMRNLLSAARLHLSIREISENNLKYFNHIMQKCSAEAEGEYKRDSQDASLRFVFLAAGKRYYPKWKVRHLRHISYYLKESSRSLISEIQEVNNEGGFSDKDAREKLISLYCFHNPML